MTISGSSAERDSTPNTLDPLADKQTLPVLVFPLQSASDIKQDRICLVKMTFERGQVWWVWSAEGGRGLPLCARMGVVIRVMEQRARLR